MGSQLQSPLRKVNTHFFSKQIDDFSDGKRQARSIQTANVKVPCCSRGRNIKPSA